MRETSWGRVKYRTTNWKAYNAALKARGELTIWLDRDMQWLLLRPHEVSSGGIFDAGILKVAHHPLG